MEIFGDLIGWYSHFWINNWNIHFRFWFLRFTLLIDAFIICLMINDFSEEWEIQDHFGSVKLGV
jgi:hypothetical protein